MAGQNHFHPVHRTLFTVISMQTRNMSGVLFTLLWLVPWIRFLAAIRREGFSETIFFVRKSVAQATTQTQAEQNCSSNYRRLHLPVIALAQNMFSCDVKRLSFSSQTFKFSRSKVKFYFSTLLKGKMILINKKGRNYQKGVPLSTICGIKWKNLRRIILSSEVGRRLGCSFKNR